MSVFSGRPRAGGAGRAYLWAVLLVLLAALQYRLWLGAGGHGYSASLRQQIAGQLQVNAALQQRNDALVVEVKELQQGDEGLEEKAREDMGMVRRDETYFLYLPYEH